MNYKMIGYVLRYIICAEAAMMLLPLAVSFIYGESAWVAFTVSIALCLLFSFPFNLKKPQDTDLRIREGFVAVALGWILMSIMGSLPFLISGCIKSPVDALFETVSGFTTTGASILAEVESLPKSILFWRSFTHWIGGMGVLVFVLTILPVK